ncbi:BrnT family toxin [Methylobacterium sp. Leaf399]|uniref:BrnT family toxin n=1 Tax=Methylobacterium sp. Leaf399 TaxID=1736364 RepID=UPI001910D349|nr:BrnT family toxin [Methylobacterium sp. Leaf399]
MEDISYEWNEEKRNGNLIKHGIDFRDVISVFSRPHLTFPSMRGDENRNVTLGVLGLGAPGSGVIAVVWTDRGGVRRIISARRARRNERDIYHAGRSA